MSKFLALDVTQTLVSMGLLAKSARQNMNLRQIDLATKLGISAQTISKIEKGSPTVEAGTLLQVLWMLGLSQHIINVNAQSPHISRERIKTISKETL